MAKKLEPLEAAEDLLKSILTEEERLEVWKTGMLTLSTPRGKFTINGFSCNDFGTPSYNIKGEDGTKYCIHLCEFMGLEKFPYYDHLAAQILLLKTQPERFIAQANSDNRMRDFVIEQEREPYPGVLDMLGRINEATGVRWTLRVPARINPFEDYQRFILSSDQRSYVCAISNYEISEIHEDRQLIQFLEARFMQAINENLVGRRDFNVDIMNNGAWRW